MSKEEQIAEHRRLLNLLHDLRYELAATNAKLLTVAGKARELSIVIGQDNVKALKLTDEVVCSELRKLLVSDLDLKSQIADVERQLALFPGGRVEE